jgi:hypothetical protein
MRVRDDPAELDRARAAVAAWRDQNPTGTAGQLVAALGAQFHPDYGPVLRGMLFPIDRDRATGPTDPATPPDPCPGPGGSAGPGFPGAGR